MKKQLLATMLAVPLALSSAYAQDSGSAIKISGFGTGALTWTDTDDAEFIRAGQLSGAGKSPRTGVDSNLGLQADAQINDWLSVTGQGLVRKSTDGHYGAEATLAFAKAKLSDNLSVRVGRTAVPVFMVSDFRNVGYANTMLRAPQEVYGQTPSLSIDGGDVTWQQSIGATTITAQASYGRTADKMVGGGEFEANGQRVYVLSAEHGPVTVRVSRSDAKVKITLPYYAMPEMEASFTGAGLALDWNNIVAQTEYAVVEFGGDDAPAWYAMAGYRIGKVLPYYSHSKISGLRGQQKTDTVGVRWDAFSSAAIKFQVDRVAPQGPGLFTAVKPGFKGPVTVGAVSIDFVF